MKSKRNIESISREAVNSQRASFRIEGIRIPEKRAEQIRQEVVKEFKQKSISSAS